MTREGLTVGKIRVSPRRKFSMMVLSALAYLFVVGNASPVYADDGSWTCDDCTYSGEGGPFTSCGVVKLNAIAGSCGMGSGFAYCTNDGNNQHYNPGMWVQCYSGGIYECDKYGDSCRAVDSGGSGGGPPEI